MTQVVCNLETDFLLPIEGFKGGGGGERGAQPHYFLQSLVFCNHFEEQ